MATAKKATASAFGIDLLLALLALFLVIGIATYVVTRPDELERRTRLANKASKLTDTMSIDQVRQIMGPEAEVRTAPFSLSEVAPFKIFIWRYLHFQYNVTFNSQMRMINRKMFNLDEYPGTP